MLAIRLMRTGKIHAPHYRIVVQEKRSKLNGKAVEMIGHYHPAQADKLLVINDERAQYWLSKGAQPSDTVVNLFVKKGLLDKSRKVTKFYTAAPKEEVATPAAETPAEEAAAAVETAEETVAAAEEAPVAVEETPEIAEEAPVAEVSTEEVAPEAETVA